MAPQHFTYLDASRILVIAFCSAFAHAQDAVLEAEVLPIGPSNNNEVAANLSVVWMAPFFSGGGYCSEATAIVAGISAHTKTVISIQQHGDSLDRDYVFGLPESTYESLQHLASVRLDRARTISVCHSEPGAWHINRSLAQRYSTSFCPLQGSAYSIGRTMFETDRTPSGWADRLQGMREIWVPTTWQADIFSAAGVDRSRLVVIPEPVDTSIFRPWSGEERMQEEDAQRQAWLDARSGRLPRSRRSSESGPLFAPRMCLELDEEGVPREPIVRVRKGSSPACPYRFLAVGKWERRKGFDLLLRALYSAFGRRAGQPHEEDDWFKAFRDGSLPPVDVESAGTDTSVRPHVELYVLTSAYHSSTDFEAALADVIKSQLTCGSGAPGSIPSDVLYSERDGSPIPLTDYTPASAYCLEPGQVGTGVGRGVLPPIHLLTGLAQRDLPGVYRGNVDALIQPSRGEGWGRPHVEAMASGLPVLATNWSGPLTFLHAGNGYPIRVAGMAPIPDGAFKGHMQAEADVGDMTRLMRHVVSAAEEAEGRGGAARADMERLYSPRAVASLIQDQLHRIARVLDAEAAEAVLANAAAERMRGEEEARYRRMEAEARARLAEADVAAVAAMERAAAAAAAAAAAEEEEGAASIRRAAARAMEEDKEGLRSDL